MEKLDPSSSSSSSGGDITSIECGVGFPHGHHILCRSPRCGHLTPDIPPPTWNEDGHDFPCIGQDSPDRCEQNFPRIHSAIFEHDYESLNSWWGSPKSGPRKFQSIDELGLKQPDFYSIRANSWREVVLDQVLNVEYLDIGEFEYNLQPQDHLHLPSVRIFSWHPHHPPENSPSEERQLEVRRTALKIMQAAPYLERINSVHFDTDYFIILQAEKVYAVKTLSLPDTVNPYHLLEFVKARPRLMTLQLKQTKENDEMMDDEDEEKVNQMELKCYAVQELLRSSRLSLEYLDLTQFCGGLDIQIPVLPNCTHLILGNTHGPEEEGRILGPSRLFPGHIQLHQTFPNLHVLDCSRLSCHDNSYYDIYFPHLMAPRDHLESVKVLIASDGCTHFWMEKLKGLCSNFTKLIVQSHGGGGKSQNLAFMLLKVFTHWKHLEELEIRIENFPTGMPSHYCLDSAFTGMRDQVCGRLRDLGREEQEGCLGETKERGDKLRVRPYIGTLQCLRNLNIIFEHRCLRKLACPSPTGTEGGGGDKGGNWAPLSFVSAIYGFQQLPDLNVTILFDQKCPWGEAMEKNLDCILPYVTLKHRHDPGCRREKHHGMGVVRFNC